MINGKVDKLKSIQSIASFELKIDVRKAIILQRQGETNYLLYPQWLLIKKSKYITFDMSGQDLDRVISGIQKYNDTFKELVDPETAIGYRSKLLSKKTNDGYNGIRLGASCVWYEIKTDVVIERYIRASIKSEIEKMYHVWLNTVNANPQKPRYSRTHSRVLPSKLLQQLMDVEIEIDNFFEKLYKERKLVDIKRV